MTTPQNPEENPERSGDDSNSTPSVPPEGAAGPATRRGFNWRSRWVLIGGGVAGIVAVVVVVAAVMLTAGGGGNGSASTLELVPDDTEVLFVLNLAAVRSAEADFPGDYDDFVDELQDEIESEFDTEEIGFEQVNSIIVAAENESFDGAVVMQGDFFFGDIQDEWEDREYEEDSYRGYEIWDGGNYFVLLEEAGAIVASGSEDQVKDLINIVDRGTGALADDPEEDLARIVSRLGPSPVMIAAAGDSGEQCENAVAGCAGFGLAYSGADPDREEVTVNLVVLFSSERRAERAIDDYDDVADLMESLLDGFADEADDFAGLPNAEDVDVDDLLVEGEFVVGTGYLEIDLDE